MGKFRQISPELLLLSDVENSFSILYLEHFCLEI